MTIYDRSAESTLGPCGTEITLVGRGALDEHGHPVAMYHIEAVGARSRAVSLVRKLHRLDAEHLVPLCAECRKVFPCPTVKALDDA